MIRDSKKEMLNIECLITYLVNGKINQITYLVGVED
jgi:hypothetical protein